MSIILTLLMLVSFGISLIIAIFMYNVLKRIPEKHRTVEPYFALLVLIPFAGLVFLWIVVLKLPLSLQNYNIKMGKGYGLAFVISHTLCLIPGINLIACVPGIVFLVLYLIQIKEVGRQLPILTEVSPVGKTSDRYELLAKLKNLFDTGAITKEEFDVEKQKIMAN